MALLRWFWFLWAAGVPWDQATRAEARVILSACCALALRPAGFTSRNLRHYLAPQLGKTPEDMTSGQISYDLRRLRAHQIIERIPHGRSYQVTADGLAIALFFTRLAQRVLIPGLAQLTDPGPPPGTRTTPSCPRLLGRACRNFLYI